MPHTSEVLEDCLADERLSRLAFLKGAGRLVATAITTDCLTPMLANAAETDSLSSILAQPGDEPMNVDISIYEPDQEDITEINSGFFNQKHFWLPTPRQWANREDQMMQVAAASAAATQDSGDTFYVIRSDYSNTPNGFAPFDCGPKSPYANYLRYAIASNPLAAGFAVLNEPDRSFRNEGILKAAIAAAKLSITADQVMQEVGYKGKLLVPSISDTTEGLGSEFLKYYVGYLKSIDYTFQTETYLTGHDYAGLKHGRLLAMVTKATLARKHFPSDIKQPFSNEGGYIYEIEPTAEQYVFEYVKHPNLHTQELRQARRMIYMYGIGRALGYAAMTNYEFHDSQDGGAGFMSAYINYDGSPHLIFNIRDLLKQPRPLSSADRIKMSHIMNRTDYDMLAMSNRR